MFALGFGLYLTIQFIRNRIPPVPFNKLIKPKATQGKKKSTLLQEEIEYSVNMAKWQAATEWAKQKGYIFRILTEKEIFNQ